MNRLFSFIVAIFAISSTISGCIFVVGAAAGAAAIGIVYDHRNIDNRIEDMHIADRILKKIRYYPYLRDDSHIEVSVFNRVVLLMGQTPESSWRQEAADLAASVPNVAKVYNQIDVQAPTSTLTKTSDSWITTKIKGQMLADQALKSSSIKVITENGVTYLMGRVSREQAKIAVDIARNVTGVQRVIRVFQYTN